LGMPNHSHNAHLHVVSAAWHSQLHAHLAYVMLASGQHG
jgi:hypothetical protein